MFINHLDIIKTTGVELKAVISLPYTIIVIVLSILTVFISLIIPAIKLSRITIIDALKKNDEVKVKQRKLKTNKFQKKFLSFNNQLAYKNYKRQGRKSKVIIGSLVLSMVLFVSIMSFSRLINLSIDERKGTYDIRCWVGSEEENQELLQYLNNNSLVDNYYYYEAEYGLTADIDNSYLKNDKKIR
jgi:ABC-type lipoprotein release transport system permease subunit